MSTDTSVEDAVRIAMTILSQQPATTPEAVAQAVDAALAATTTMQRTVDAEAVRRRVEASVNVYVAAGSVLDDHDANHMPWLDARRADIDWRFWGAYRDWLERRMPLKVVRRLDQVSDDILSRLENPRRTGVWDRRGMVVGQVQSGKTANYTALVCKAADAGYRFIVVLAGLHNSLRSQTQRRLDEGFLGLDSRTTFAVSGRRQPLSALGVAEGGRIHPSAWTLTSSDETGDFSRAVAGRFSGRLGSDPVLLVVKKHKTILDNLVSWVAQNNGVRDPSTGDVVVSGVPVLVIDDEADNASVNTKKVEFEYDDAGELLSEIDPSVINASIRRLLNSFDQSALVSYTATPFANIFIEDLEPSPTHGEDLFPRSFIIRIPAPTNYIGPPQVFGIPAAEDPEGVERPGMPVIRTVVDADTWMPSGHRKEHVPTSPPPSLIRALRSFVLVCAARSARGQTNVHNSMLVHVTRFVAVQGLVARQITEEMDALRDALLGFGGGTGPAEVMDGLRRLWEQDFVPTSASMPDEFRCAEARWADVEAAVPAAVGRIRVLEINGSARDALEYADNPEGVALIAVGGDKLSRGLTLEGLTVSYYLRATRMYDTLMQMGRWFGYRDGYADLVRLYTTDELIDWYRDITIANEELSAKFDEMARVGSHPRDFSLYVRKSPAGLLVTAQAKMRSGRSMQLTFSDDVIETIGFRRDPQEQLDNLSLTERFLTNLGAPSRDGRSHPLWRGVAGSSVAALLEAFRTAQGAKKARGPLLAQYIRSRLVAGELTEWTVALAHNSQTDLSVSFGGITVGLTRRAEYVTGDGPETHGRDYRIRRIGDQTHEVLDLTEDERREAEALREADLECRRARARVDDLDPAQVKPPALGPFGRRVRPVTRGLLVLYPLDPAPARMPQPPAVQVSAIVGFMVSFPVSPGAPTIEYVVPERYWEREMR